MQKITVLGAGSWGSALSNLLADNQIDVMVYTNEESVCQEINNNHTNKFYLGEVAMNEKVVATANLDEALEHSSIILYVIPTKAAESIFTQIKEKTTKKIKLINASKGIHPESLKTIEQLAAEILGDQLSVYCTLSGPSHAEEVIERKMTFIVAASHDQEFAEMVQHWFSNINYFRVYTTNDVKGVEFMASAKNVIAVGSGMLAGIGQGDNARAALITRSMKELSEIAEAIGCDVKTIYGLAGLGDLIVTTSSEHSRNFQFGKKLSSTRNVEEALADMKMVAEGVRSAKAIKRLADENNIKATIVTLIYDILYNSADESDLALIFAKKLTREYE